jgi:hypothetical protein
MGDESTAGLAVAEDDVEDTRREDLPNELGQQDGGGRGCV